MTSSELGRGGVAWLSYLHPIQSIYNYVQTSSIMRHNWLLFNDSSSSSNTPCHLPSLNSIRLRSKVKVRVPSHFLWPTASQNFSAKSFFYPLVVLASNERNLKKKYIFHILDKYGKYTFSLNLAFLHTFS